MKNTLLILTLSLVSFAMFGQTKPTEVAPDSYIREPSYQYIFGTTADTLTNADTLSWVVRIKGDKTQDFAIKLYNDYVSGTAGGKLKTYSSPDGVNYEVTAAGDSITVTGLGADALDAEVITLDDYLRPYLKFIYIQSGTAVTIPRVYIYTKEN